MFQQLSQRAAFLTMPRFVVVAVGIAIGLGLVAGVSLAAAQRGEPGEPPTAQSYQGCVNSYTGVLRIVRAGEQCQDHELPIQLGGGGSDTALLERIAQLETTVTTLQQENSTQQTTINTLVTDNAALQAQVPDCLSTEDGEVYFTGCNVNVRSGAGATDAPVNGLGNLIIGYNENVEDTHTGSHNLVVGNYHSYSSFGGLVAGYNNTISGAQSSVSGGINNIASGNYSSVSGGGLNTASGLDSSVSGGLSNTASGPRSSVSGGFSNTASGGESSVSGGRGNTASGGYSSVSGGFGRSAPNGFDWRGGEYLSDE